MTTKNIFNVINFNNLDVFEKMSIPVLAQYELVEVFLVICLLMILIFYLFLEICHTRSYGIINKSLISTCAFILFHSLLLVYNDNLIWFYNAVVISNTISQNFLGFFIKFFILFISLFCLLILQTYVIKHKVNCITEYFIIILFSLLGLLLIIVLNDLFCIFLAIEMQSLSFYLLAAYKKESLYSVENGFKYLILGAISSSFFLFGSCYLYGLTGLFSIFDFNLFWFINQVPNQLSFYFIFWETNNITLITLCSLLVSVKFFQLLYICLYSEFYDFFETDFFNILWLTDNYYTHPKLINQETNLQSSELNFVDLDLIAGKLTDVEAYRQFTSCHTKYDLEETIFISKEGDELVCKFKPFSTLFPESNAVAVTLKELNFLKRLHAKTVLFKNTFINNYETLETIIDFINNAFDFVFKDVNSYNFVNINSNNQDLLKKTFDKQKLVKEESYDLFFKGDQLLKNFKQQFKTIFDKCFFVLVPYMTKTEINNILQVCFDNNITSIDFMKVVGMQNMSLIINDVFCSTVSYQNSTGHLTFQNIKIMLLKKYLADNIVERLVNDNAIFFWYLQHIWKDELFGENLCLNESVTNNNLNYIKLFQKDNFFDFRFFILNSFFQTFKILNKKLEHLQTVKKLSDLLLSKNKDEEVCTAIVKVGKKNANFEKCGLEIFFSNHKKFVYFISSYVINHEIENLKKEIFKYEKDCLNFCKLISVCDSFELTNELQKITNYDHESCNIFKKCLYYQIYNKSSFLVSFDKCKWMPHSWMNYLNSLFYLEFLSEYALIPIELNIAMLEEILFYLTFEIEKVDSHFMISDLNFYSPFKDKVLGLYILEYAKFFNYFSLDGKKIIYDISVSDLKDFDRTFFYKIPQSIRTYCLMKLTDLIPKIKKDSIYKIISKVTNELLKNQQLSNYTAFKYAQCGGNTKVFLSAFFRTTCYGCSNRFEEIQKAEKLEFYFSFMVLYYGLLKHHDFSIDFSNKFNTHFPILLNVYTLEILQNETVKTSALTQTYNLSVIFLIFIIISLLFKLAAAPFHYWSIDIYEGSPTSSTFIFTIIPKLSILVLMIKFYFYSFYFFFINDLYQYVIISVLLSIIISSIGGISEKKLKSLFAYSAINNLGYILFSSTIGLFTGIQSLYFYLFIYTISNFVVWAILMSLQVKKVWYTNKINKDFTDLLILKKTNPFLVYIFKLVLISIAGVPPLIGFLSKLNIFLVSIEASLYLMTIFITFFNLISTFYYLRILKILYFEKAVLGKLHENITLMQAYVICFFFFFLLYLFMNPWFILLSSYKITLY